MKVMAICGSLKANSANLDLLKDAQRVAPEGIEVVLFEELDKLPHFNPDLESSDKLPVVDAWRRSIAESDALLIACPEYAFSLPGALKNAVDWTVGTGELESKVIGVTASVNHPERGKRGLKALCDTLGAVSARIVGAEPIVQGPKSDEDLKRLLQQIAKEVGEDRGENPEL